MSKNSKIAVIVSILAVIVLIVVLSSTVFSIHTAKLIWYNTPTSTLASLDDATALKCSQAESESVFLLDREKAISNLEKKYPALRVIDVEIAWPNIMRLHVIEREVVYAVPIKDGKYALTDEYFKVLDIVSSFASTKSNAILFKTEAFLDVMPEKSDFLDVFGSSIYQNIYDAFLKLGRTLSDMRAIISSVELSTANEDTCLIMDTFMGLKFKLDKPISNTNAKMRLCIKTFDLLTSADYLNKTIEVFVNSNNVLEARVY